MYSCPTDDIHSIYLDRELPSAYAVEYEEHLRNCKKCSEKLNALKTLKGVFEKDSKSLDFDQKFMDESYVRLMAKIRHSRNTGFTDRFSVQKFVAGTVAAAAVLVAVILPVRTSPGGKPARDSSLANLVPVERPQTTLISNKNIVINGNINDNLSQAVSTGALRNTSLADLDVFRPEFRDSRIKISVPGMEVQNSPVMEVRMPANTIAGLLP